MKTLWLWFWLLLCLPLSAAEVIEDPYTRLVVYQEHGMWTVHGYRGGICQLDLVSYGFPCITTHERQFCLTTWEPFDQSDKHLIRRITAPVVEVVRAPKR